jgi:hypothetical protein
MRWKWSVACMGNRRGAYRFLVEKPKENNPLRTPRRRWGIILEKISKISVGRTSTETDLVQH